MFNVRDKCNIKRKYLKRIFSANFREMLQLDTPVIVKNTFQKVKYI